MTRLMSVIVVSLVSSSFAASPQQPQWSPKYGEALTRARSTRRPLLVVLEDVSHPNRQLHQVVHTDDAKQNGLLTKYALCRIDVSTSYGKRVAGAFQAVSYPYTVIANMNTNEIVYRHAGQVSDKDWVSTLASYQEGGEKKAKRARLKRRKSVFSFFSSSPAFCPT